MSVEEWLLFHANPTIEALNRELVIAQFNPFHDCECIRVTDVLINHVSVGKELDYLARFRALGFRTTSTFILEMCMQFGYEQCIQYVDVSGCVPDEELIWHMLRFYGPYEDYTDDDERPYTDHEKDLIINLVDRYPSVEPYPDDDDLTMFIREFLAVRASAASGTFSTMHALKKMVGKDAARMIGRVVWSERKNYHLSRPNKK